MADDHNDGRGAPPSHIHVEGGQAAAAAKTNWLPWILAGLALLALLFALSQCDRRDKAVVAPVAEPAVATDTVTNGVAVAPDAGVDTVLSFARARSQNTGPSSCDVN